MKASLRNISAKSGVSTNSIYTVLKIKKVCFQQSSKKQSGWVDGYLSREYSKSNL